MYVLHVHMYIHTCVHMHTNHTLVSSGCTYSSTCIQAPDTYTWKLHVILTINLYIYSWWFWIFWHPVWYLLAISSAQSIHLWNPRNISNKKLTLLFFFVNMYIERVLDLVLVASYCYYMYCIVYCMKNHCSCGFVEILKYWKFVYLGHGHLGVEFYEFQKYYNDAIPYLQIAITATV